MTAAAPELDVALPDLREPARVGHLVFGVLLPIVALAYELSTGASAALYFDPTPTWWHVLLVASVPLANAYAIWVLALGRADRAITSLRVTAFALPVALFYAALYLPILPLSALAVIVYGLGILPFAPLFAALSTWRLRRRLRGRHPEAVGPSRAGWATAAGLLALLVFEAGGWLAQAGFVLADGEDDATRRHGIALLRWAAPESAMLRVVHRGRARANLTGHLLFGEGPFRSPWGSHADRKRDGLSLYRATGLLASETRPPATPGRRSEFFWVPDAPGVIPGLSLASSRLDGTVHPEADLVYLEWTLELRNSRGVPREARAEVVLPPDAVVTRATLWVGDEPRDAAFGPRDTVTQAYDRVTRARRDPLLVTAAGRDRVAIRCFPVPGDGSMRIRLGITAPLLLDAERGALRLPELASPNFGVPEGLERHVWIDSPVGFESEPPGLTDEAGEGGHSLRGALAEGTGTWLEVARGADALVWAADAVSPNGVAIAQHVEETRAPVRRLVVVVDGSRSTAAHVDGIADALARLPASVELGILLASDPPVELLAPDADRGEGIERLRDSSFFGGQDAVPALVRAFERADASPAAAVLWIHRPVPHELSSPGALRQRFARRHDGPRWLALQTRSGVDALVSSLMDAGGLDPIPRRAGVGEDLADALDRLSGRKSTYAVVRERRAPPAGAGVAPPGSARSAHLTRLWARDEVRSLLRVSGLEAEAAALATRYRVVTPVSGAVVLERNEQYAQNELASPAAGADQALAGAPSGIGGPLASVPEPGTGALTAVGLTALAIWRRERRRRGARRG